MAVAKVMTVWISKYLKHVVSQDHFVRSLMLGIGSAAQKGQSRNPECAFI